MLFKGRTQLRKTGPQGISALWGWVRNYGKTWHGGADAEGLDNTNVLMPSYTDPQTKLEKAISGVVTTARIVTNRSNPTWEWGYYVCVKLDAGQTPDTVNYLYFAHNAKLLVKAGQRVKTGDALAVMGMTGNAAGTYPHCHFEVRATTGGRGLDPTAYMGHPNRVGVYSAAPAQDKPCAVQVDKLRLRCGPGKDYAVLELLAKGTKLEPAEVDSRNGWTCRKLTGTEKIGWLAVEYVG